MTVNLANCQNFHVCMEWPLSACCTAIPDNAVRSALSQQQLGSLFCLAPYDRLLLVHYKIHQCWWYSTSTGERESRPFREEPWHLHYVSSLSMHSMHSALPTCQPPFIVRSLNLLKFDLTTKKKKKKSSSMC